MDKLFKNVEEKQSELRIAISELENAIYDNIDRMPDNPHIVRNKNSFTITSKALLAGESVWTVYFHDWKSQLEDIKLVVHDALNGNTGKLNTLLKDHKIMHDLHLEKVHPEVINAVTPILLKIDMLLKSKQHTTVNLELS